MVKTRKILTQLDALVHKLDDLTSRIEVLEDKKAAGEEAEFQVCQPILFNLQN